MDDNSPLGDAPDSSCSTVVRGRTFERDEPRPPLGHARTQEALSDYEVAHHRWQRDKAAKEAAEKVMADLLARRVVLPEDLERAAEKLRQAS